MFLTVGTGRNREDIARALVLSIRHHRPDRVWLLVTTKSQEETVPLMLREMRRTPPVELKSLDQKDDAEACQRAAHQLISCRIRAGASPGDLVVDYTSGTKAMSAGLFAAAVAAGVETITYVSGLRDEGGRVLPGSERFLSFAPRSLFAEREMNVARRLFDANLFEAAEALAASVKGCGDRDLEAPASWARPWWPGAAWPASWPSRDDTPPTIARRRGRMPSLG
jgi:hypothetical protein